VSRSRFLPNTAALGVTTAATALLTLVQVKILAGHLSRETFGLFLALRGLSLLLALAAANGLPQLLVRYLPEHEARAQRRAGIALSAGCALAFAAVMAAVILVVGRRDAVFAGAPRALIATPFLFWFYATTVGTGFKLLVYGALNGMRRLEVQTALETTLLVVQVAWIWTMRDALSVPALFRILGTVSLVGAALGVVLWAVLLARGGTRGEAGVSSHAGAYARYWLGALGLSAVAVAFSDVDRYVLSAVLALESVSLFHVGSRIARLANRLLAVPVLAFQPEVTRIDAEGRADRATRATEVFLKFSVALAVLLAAGLITCATEIIRVVSSGEYLPARGLLYLLALSVPLSAITAPLTTVMKARDRVHAAAACDLGWALVYLGGVLALGRALGVIGAGLAQLAACGVQLALAATLGDVTVDAERVWKPLGKALTAAALGFAPAALAGAWLPADELVRSVARVALALAGVWAYPRLLRALSYLSAEEGAQLDAALARAPLGALARRVAR
jgi:O-antigen/teichoic acid export membrane protein